MLQIGLELVLLVPKDLSREGLAWLHGFLCMFLILAKSHIWHLSEAEGQQLTNTFAVLARWAKAVPSLFSPTCE